MKLTIRVFLPVLLVCFVIWMPLIVLGAMNKSKAITEAHKIWGDSSHVDNGITWAETFDTYQIGYMVSGCGSAAPVFRVVAEGVGSWDAAFAALPPDKGISAKISGIVDFHETTLPPAGPTPTTTGSVSGTVVPPNAIVSQDPLPGTIIAAQLVIDGKLYGNPVQIQTAPWTIVMPVDSKTMSNGQHITCTKFWHSDNSWNFSTPGMFLVQNP